MQAYPSPEVDIYLNHNDVVTVGSCSFKVLHTPGHTRGSVSLYSEKSGLVFTGDVLFAGAVGSGNSSASSETDLHSSLKVLMGLPGSTIVYPGHRESTTIDNERCMVESLLGF
jgi:glyoxylase-like metal-dependent hydrolase (beta-lactamase superfamily II)